MGGKPEIQDEFTGKGTPSWRYQARRRKLGICLRCPNKAREGKLTCGCDKVRGVKGE